MFFKHPIAIGLSPNTEAEDVWQAVKILFQPGRWKKGSSIQHIEDWFKRYFGVEDAVSFNSGRSALYALLKIFNIGKGDQILIQAFTCVAVPDAVLWAGAKPIFIDIDDSLNIDHKAIERHINNKTRAIVVQHTFGTPAQINLIKEIAQKYNIILIEDCAHALGATNAGKKLGNFGDAAFFSFGRDKVISSVFGGVAIINGKWKMENGKLREFQQKLNYPSYYWIFQQIIHPIVFAFILALYNLEIGKLILFLLQKLRLLSKPVYREELVGDRPSIFPARYPNALACLLLPQLAKLEKYNSKRRELANYYFKALQKNKRLKLPRQVTGTIYLRFNLLINKAEELLLKAKKNKIILGNWYRYIIDPKEVSLQKIGYSLGSCPRAEKAAEKSVNLPTYPRLTIEETKKIVDLINETSP